MCTESQNKTCQKRTFADRTTTEGGAPCARLVRKEDGECDRATFDAARLKHSQKQRKVTKNAHIRKKNTHTKRTFVDRRETYRAPDWCATKTASVIGRLMRLHSQSKNRSKQKAKACQKRTFVDRTTTEGGAPCAGLLLNADGGGERGGGGGSSADSSIASPLVATRHNRQY